MERAKRHTFLVLAVFLAALSAFFCIRNRDELSFPPTPYVELDSPYLIRDTFSSRYILDKQRTRILVVDKATNTVQTVWPQRQKGADVFYYADEFMFDEKGFVYVKEGSWNGNCIAREAVLVYDNAGRYLCTVLDTHYAELVNKHKMHLLSVRDGKLHYAVREQHCVVVASYDIERNTEWKKVVPFDNAFDFVSDMTEDEAGNIYLLDKTGALFMLNPDKTHFDLVYRAPSDEFPNWIEADGAGTLLYTDLYADTVVRLNVRSGEKSVALTEAGSVTVTPVPFSSLQNPLKNKTMRTRQVVLICAFAVFCLSAFFACILLLVAFFKRKMHVIQR
ncbi:MAG: hypothetical protein K6G80_02480, partial [Treponema sp.]|nr:hypothetical protein [Treponema sp.]